MNEITRDSGRAHSSIYDVPSQNRRIAPASRCRAPITLSFAHQSEISVRVAADLSMRRMAGPAMREPQPLTNRRSLCTNVISPSVPPDRVRSGMELVQWSKRYFVDKGLAAHFKQASDLPARRTPPPAKQSFAPKRENAIAEIP